MWQRDCNNGCFTVVHAHIGRLFESYFNIQNFLFIELVHLVEHSMLWLAEALQGLRMRKVFPSIFILGYFQCNPKNGLLGATSISYERYDKEMGNKEKNGSRTNSI